MQATSLALDHLLCAVGDPIADLASIGPGHPEFDQAQIIRAAAGVLAKSRDALPGIAQVLETSGGAPAPSQTGAHLAAAESWLRDEQVAIHVSPVLLRQLAPLALVRGAYNAVHVVGDAVGDTLYYGKGAGQMPTASSVVADLIDMAVGRTQRTFHTLRLWSGNGRHLQLRPAATVRSRFYLRVQVEDRPGVLADIARELAAHQISIASVIQHEALDEQEGSPVPLVIMTHTAQTGSFRAALTEIDRLGSVTAPSVYYPVAD